MATTRTTCPYCGVGCGVLVSPGHDAQPARVRGDPDHPANFGRLCSKGSALGETLGLEGRLLFPMQKQADESYRPVSWSAALDRIATGFRDIIARHGANAVAIYLSGQLLTEDYYVANKLMKGFLGSSNVDTNSRLCMASTVAGHRRAFGADTVPGCYEDLDQADLVVLVGSNAAWCHPVLFQRIVRNRTERGAKLVVIDTRRTTTAESADLFLEIAPGSDQALFGGLLVYLEKFGAFDAEYIRAHTRGLPDALEAARAIAPSIRETALATGLRETDVVSFFDLFARTPRTVTAFSQGVNQSAQGTDKVNAILNCHLATGRIGRIGASPFSLTGQPNAMGGREVGGLANSLAAHMGFDADSVDRVRRFWNAPNMAVTEGRKAVDMFDASRARRDQGALGGGHESRRVAAECGRGPVGPRQARPVRRVGQCVLQRYDQQPSPFPSARRSVGREERDGHQFRKADFPAAGVQAGAREGARGLGHLRGFCKTHGIRRLRFRLGGGCVS